MNPIRCIIVEDEARNAKYLKDRLEETGFPVHIQAQLESVAETVQWLTENKTDLIFLDIQLGDGTSFEIFDSVEITTPVIFTTSYSEFIQRSFELNNISYLMKPVTTEELKAALTKFEKLQSHYSGEPVNQLISSFNSEFQKRFLINTGMSMVILPVEKITFFSLESKRQVVVFTTENNQYLIPSNLKLLEQRLDPEVFFRINQQVILNINHIHSLKVLEKGRLQVVLNPPSKMDLTVSTERTSAFKIWLNR